MTPNRVSGFDAFGVLIFALFIKQGSQKQNEVRGGSSILKANRVLEPLTIRITRFAFNTEQQQRGSQHLTTTTTHGSLCFSF
jgi:hypothetical protein